MASPSLYGPCPLTTEGIDDNIPVKSAGVYALGYTSGNIFYIYRTGRSDDDVKGRLKQQAGDYAQFKFAYASSAKDAFQKECELYHDYPGVPDNKIHPARPGGSGWRCPRCPVFD